MKKGRDLSNRKGGKKTGDVGNQVRPGMQEKKGRISGLNAQL